MNIKRMTLLAMYTTIALTIFVVESAIPPLAPIPGIKLGLANVITLWLLIYATWRDALTALLMRIFIASMVTGQLVSFFYSLCGGLLCFLAMALLYRLLGRRYIVFVSIIGALFHNVGQIGIAMVLLDSLSAAAYLPVLLISGVITGTFTGLCAYFASRRLPRHVVWPLP
ncbi:MAG: Gx transporter family protein [Lachnospiraceae bacterium]|jgi:heptaprenyl diphosphate synthase|nr:Gx transporter family protein [Lachnospiraceae bacterium]